MAMHDALGCSYEHRAIVANGNRQVGIADLAVVLCVSNVNDWRVEAVTTATVSGGFDGDPQPRQPMRG